MKSQTACYDREKIFQSLHHMLKPAEEDAVRRHLAECAACRGVEESYRELDGVLDEWKGMEPSPSFDARLQQRLDERRPSLLGMLFTRPVTRALAAAAVLIVIVAGTFELHRMRTTTAPGTVPGSAAVAKKVLTPAQRPTQASLSADEELKMYENLPVLENYDMLANFDVLSELAPEKKK